MNWGMNGQAACGPVSPQLATDAGGSAAAIMIPPVVAM